MKRYFIFFLLLCASMTMMSQSLRKFSIVSFEEKPFDMTASDPRYKIEDGNGALFSIIKLVSKSPEDNLSAYSFDFGLCEDREKTIEGERWIYVQRNAMHVTIKREGFQTVKSELNLTVQEGKVYEMVLSPEAQKVQKQMVAFKINPASANATIMYKSDKPGSVEEMLGAVDANGEFSENLEFGTYTYRIVSKNYYTSEGRLVLNNMDETYMEEITLRPKFSTITLNAAEGVEIRIDGETVGVGSWTGDLNAGTYNVECHKECYKPKADVIKVEEGSNATIELKPLEPILGALSVKSSPFGASIVIDGQEYGNTPRNINNLLIGKHTVVVSKDGYQSATKVVTIKEGDTEMLDVTLDKNPEKGSLYIASTPKGASVTVGSVDYGKTPCSINELFPGRYNVYVSKKGYQNMYKSVDVAAGERETVNFSLSKTSKSKKSYNSKSSGSKGNVNFGLTGSLGFMSETESSNYSSYDYYYDYGYSDPYSDSELTAFSGDFGLLMRVGVPTKSMFSFITGLKMQYLSTEDIDAWLVMVPFNLNWNYLRDSKSAFYFGVGASPGIEIDDEEKTFCYDLSVQYLGFATRHHDINLFVKGFITSEDAAITTGFSYTYYF